MLRILEMRFCRLSLATSFLRYSRFALLLLMSAVLFSCLSLAILISYPFQFVYQFSKPHINLSQNVEKIKSFLEIHTIHTNIIRMVEKTDRSV